MKKLMIIAFVGGAFFSMTSCKKDYTCECTYSSGGTTLSSSTTINATKKDAESACEASASTGGSTWTCKIK